jgi:hypothetical protein
MTNKERIKRKAKALRSIADDLVKQAQRMPRTYTRESEQLNRISDKLRHAAAELAESGVVRL